MSIADITKQYRNGTLSPVDVIKAELDKIHRMDRRVNPIAHMFDEKELLQMAEESAQRYKEGKSLGAFDGIPVTFKDDGVIKGYRSTMGSFFFKIRAFEMFGMGGDAPKESENSVKMFQDSGAIPLCVTTTPENCCTEGCATFLNGTTRNPHNLLKSPGGSSGGAAALSALDIGCINMGSDMGGSIRIPAANCGQYGYKPSFTFGVSADTPYFPYFAVNGPLSKSMDNLTLYAREFQKYTNRLPNVNFGDKNVKSSMRGMRIAVSKDLDGTIDYVDSDVWDGILKVVAELKKQGAIVEFAEPPISQLGKEYTPSHVGVTLIAVEYADYAKNIKEFKGGRYEKLCVPFLMKVCEKGGKTDGITVKNNILAADQMRAIMRKFMSNYDLLLMPSTPIPPRDTLGYHEEGMIIDRIDGKKKSLGECGHAPSAFTIFTNITQNPAIVIPTGTANDKDMMGLGKLPISAMFVAPLERDDLCLKVGHALENRFQSIMAKL